MLFACLRFADIDSCMHADAGANTSTEPLRLYNLDVFEYEVNSPFGLYGAIPMIVAHTAKATVGAFWCAS